MRIVTATPDRLQVKAAQLMVEQATRAARAVTATYEAARSMAAAVEPARQIAQWWAAELANRRARRERFMRALNARLMARVAWALLTAIGTRNRRSTDHPPPLRRRLRLSTAALTTLPPRLLPVSSPGSRATC